ncbi:SDR family NAD(P)-dependent oxidoreductase [Acinetobacter baumannii]|uniref:SDR family NAD(P)-dependent oxidoreductase n=1 Tax=Acinetobacter baumannii TaxID=470 RepID=UPI003AF8225E
MYEHYSGQVVLITGAASGLGALLAEQLAKYGAKLVLGDLNIEGLNTVVEPLRQAGVEVVAQVCDVSCEADLDLSFAVNAKGVFFGMKHQIRQMLQQGGGIILNVASVAGLGAAPKLAAYAAAKHAVVGLTKTAAVEYANKGIRVNAICPFYTTTPMVVDSELKEKQDFLAQASPMKRLGHPSEVVAMMLMMCAKENSYLTGQAIAIDGGVTAY